MMDQALKLPLLFKHVIKNVTYIYSNEVWYSKYCSTNTNIKCETRCPNYLQKLLIYIHIYIQYTYSIFTTIFILERCEVFFFFFLLSNAMAGSHDSTDNISERTQNTLHLAEATNYRKLPLEGDYVLATHIGAKHAGCLHNVPEMY